MSGNSICFTFLECIIPCRKNKRFDSKSDCLPTEIRHNTETQIHKINFIWTIDQFDFHAVKKEKIRSSEFSAITNDESKWCMVVEPSNQVCNDAEILSIVLHFIPTGKNDKVLAKSDISLLNAQEKQLWRGEISMRKFENAMGCGLSGIRVRKKYISPSNKLTVCCNLTYTKFEDFIRHQNNTAVTPARQLRIPDNDHLEKFASLYNEDTFADVALSVKDKNYTAHKAILAAHSKVFASMFEANAKKGKIARIHISGINEEVIGEMLRYIYTGKCENLENLADGLLVAADRYGLDRLKMICADALYKTLSVENATDLLILADKRGLNELKSEVIKFIVAEYVEISNKEAWQNAIQRKPRFIREINQELCRQSSAINQF